jgi:fructoselysine-6-P-deglycase FrlB-like protein
VGRGDDITAPGLVCGPCGTELPPNAKSCNESAVPSYRVRWTDSPPHLAETRSFAAQLFAAADSHDHIDRAHLLMDQVERLAERLNVDLHRPLT